MSEQEPQSPEQPPSLAGRIEGGIDAVVIGATADGLAAATMLGKARLKTVLVDSSTEIGGPVRKRAFGERFEITDGEHLIWALDAQVIEQLELYRHGLSYAARRIDTAYFLQDGSQFDLEGDWLAAAAGLVDSFEEAAGFQALIHHAFAAASLLRPAFEGAPAPLRAETSLKTFAKAMEAAPEELRAAIDRFTRGSAQSVIGSYLQEGSLMTALIAEAGLRSGAPPHEPYSFMALLRRWAGEIAGLQGAVAYPHGGAGAVIDALRRAAQGARVDIRAAAPVKRILIERDCAAGVELASGGQIRAPIVIAAIDARTAFLEMLSAEEIDIEFRRAIAAPASPYASARMHMALKGAPRDARTKENMRKRILYAPRPDNLARAFATARAGDIPEDLIIEAVFPNTIDSAGADKGQLLSLIAHPLPFDEAPNQDRRTAIAQAIMTNVENFAPGLGARAVETDLCLAVDLAKATGDHVSAYAAPAGVLQQWARGGRVVSAGGVDGFYFCGPEAQIGPGISCAAGRLAAKAALRDLRRGVLAA